MAITQSKTVTKIFFINKTLPILLTSSLYFSILTLSCTFFLTLIDRLPTGFYLLWRKFGLLCGEVALSESPSQLFVFFSIPSFFCPLVFFDSSYPHLHFNPYLYLLSLVLLSVLLILSILLILFVVLISIVVSSSFIKSLKRQFISPSSSIVSYIYMLIFSHLFVSCTFPRL